MSQENVNLFWQGVDAMRRGDDEAFLDGVSEDVVWIATFRDGKLVKWEDFRERSLALEAAGLSE
jgi:ketosteroid isomerase-like protein